MSTIIKDVQTMRWVIEPLCRGIGYLRLNIVYSLWSFSIHYCITQGSESLFQIKTVLISYKCVRHTSCMDYAILIRHKKS